MVDKLIRSAPVHFAVRSEVSAPRLSVSLRHRPRGLLHRPNAWAASAKPARARFSTTNNHFAACPPQEIPNKNGLHVNPSSIAPAPASNTGTHPCVACSLSQETKQEPGYPAGCWPGRGEGLPLIPLLGVIAIQRNGATCRMASCRQTVVQTAMQPRLLFCWPQ